MANFRRIVAPQKQLVSFEKMAKEKDLLGSKITSQLCRIVRLQHLYDISDKMVSRVFMLISIIIVI